MYLGRVGGDVYKRQIMNYMNTFVVNVQSRMTDLSVIESIGMTPKQLLGMLVREGVLYTGGAWLVALPVGMGVTYLLYESMRFYHGNI